MAGGIRPDIQNSEREEGQREFAAWKTQQEKNTKKQN